MDRVDTDRPRLGSLVLSSFSALLLSPAADPARPEMVTLSATVNLIIKVTPKLWPR